MNRKTLLIIFLLLFKINVLAANETDITNVKVNGESIPCNNYVCEATINDTKAKIEYQLVDLDATATGFNSGDTFEFTEDTIVKKLVVSKKIDGLETPISSEYTFNLHKYIISDDCSLNKLVFNGKKIKISKSVFVYTEEVKYDLEEITLEVVPNSKFAIVEINTDLSFPLEESSKAIDFTVTSELGRVQEYRIIVKREEIPDATLKSIRIATGEIELKKGVYEYNINVPYDINKLNLEVETNSDDAVYEIDEDGDLVVGDNQVVITVTNKKSVLVYKLNIKRFENTGEGVVNLSNIKIKELPDFKFKNGQTEFDLYFDKIPIRLSISTETVNKDNDVDILNNTNLKEGCDPIIIRVQQKNLKLSKDYLLHIHLNKEKRNNNILLIIIISTIVLIVGLTILFIVKRKKKKNKNFDKDKMLKQVRKNLKNNEKKKKKELEKKKNVEIKNKEVTKKEEVDDSSDELEII